MKQLTTIVVLFAVLSAYAQEQPNNMPAGSDLCEEIREGIGAPYYYCDCKETSTTFHFPLETEVNDTVWYTATADDLKQGISAYWFADCSVTMEVYAFCTSKEPTIQLTVGRNQMHDIDIATINKKLDEMGKTAQDLIGIITPHVRVYPNKEGGSGKVYCYPYDQGPESTCDDPLPLRPNMTYICEKPLNSYKLEWNLIPTSGKAFMHWKQKKNKPCEMWFTLDSCNGEEVARAILSDSLHVYHLDSAMLVQTRQAKRNMWLHVQHAEGITGRIYLYANPKYADSTEFVNQSICMGKTLNVNLRTYNTDTTFVDTLWVAKDTLRTMEVNLSFTEPELEYDTVYASELEIARGYRHQPSGAVLRSFNDTIVTIEKKNTCTRLVQVTPIQCVYAGVDTAHPMDSKPYKKILNGQLYIILNDQKYTVLGQKTN